jgi:hypothetical protein
LRNNSIRITPFVVWISTIDPADFFALASQVPFRTQVAPYALEDANVALRDLREGRFTGAAVLRVRDGDRSASAPATLSEC